jgi:hypothetical protein
LVWYGLNQRVGDAGWNGGHDHVVIKVNMGRAPRPDGWHDSQTLTGDDEISTGLWSTGEHINGYRA